MSLELEDVLLLETEGETALALSVKHHRPVVVYDLCASDTGGAGRSGNQRACGH